MRKGEQCRTSSFTRQWIDLGLLFRSLRVSISLECNTMRQKWLAFSAATYLYDQNIMAGGTTNTQQSESAHVRIITFL